jgi:hypothetical protein
LQSLGNITKRNVENQETVMFKWKIKNNNIEK